MAGIWQRWRAPLLGGFAVWLMSVPLLMSHPASKPIAQVDRSAPVATNDHTLLEVLMHQRQHAAAPDAASATLSIASLAAPAAPRLAPAVAPPAPPPAPSVHANDIVIPRLGLNQPVGWYTDCLGHAAVPRWGTWRWSCAGRNNIYIMAHNPGIFTPILALHAGDIIEYGDPAGRVHTYRVSWTTIVSDTQLWPLAATPASSLTLQTCWTWDGTRDFIVRATET